MLDLGRGRAGDGYFWVVARDDRPWGGRDPPAIAYAYAPPGLGRSMASKLLDTYRGVVQCDGQCAAQCKTIAAKTPGRPRSRSPFAGRVCGDGSSIVAKGAAPIAREALAEIKPSSMRIGEMIWGMSEQRESPACARRRASRLSWRPGPLEQQLARVSGKSGLAEELRYRLNYWEGLVRFPLPGRWPHRTGTRRTLSRSAVSGPPCSIARMRCLLGMTRGLENWACIKPVDETCLLNDVEPQAHIADVLIGSSILARLAHRRLYAVWFGEVYAHLIAFAVRR